MEKSRLETLQEFLAANPDDAFVRYGLAQEYLRGNEAEKSLEQFRELLRLTPNYVPAYYHTGQTLEKLGRREEAREIYRQGIEVSGRAANLHAKSELEAALGLLG